MWIWKERTEINTEEWDHYLSQSNEPFEEFNCWYLDICCLHWGAFFNTLNDSRIPIPYVKKILINQVTRPPFLQRLKIIGHNKAQESEIVNLLDSIKKKFKCGILNWDYYFSESKIRANYIIHSREINFNQSTSRNLRKASKANLNYSIAKDPKELFDWISTNGEDYLYKKDFENSLFRNLIYKMYQQKKGFIVLAKDEYLKIQSAAIFTNSKSRFVFFLSFNSAEGKKTGSMVGIIHYVINQIMNDSQELDLEGSDIPGVAIFFEGLGAEKKSYFEYTWSTGVLCKMIFFLKNKFS